jgi:hypothetical protein
MHHANAAFGKSLELMCGGVVAQRLCASSAPQRLVFSLMKTYTSEFIDI